MTYHIHTYVYGVYAEHDFNGVYTEDLEDAKRIADEEISNAYEVIIFDESYDAIVYRNKVGDWYSE